MNFGGKIAAILPGGPAGYCHALRPLTAGLVARPGPRGGQALPGRWARRRSRGRLVRFHRNPRKIGFFL